MRKTVSGFIVFSALLWSVPGVADETRSAAGGPAPRPQAAIHDLAWLAGEWEGDGFGGQVLDSYSPPAGGQIVGHFRLVKDSKVAFYELFTIAEANGSLEMRVKHFNADLTGWEEKGEVQAFPLVSWEPNVWHFDGITLRRTGDNEITTTVAIKKKDGSVTDERLTFSRVQRAFQERLRKSP